MEGKKPEITMPNVKSDPENLEREQNAPVVPNVPSSGETTETDEHVMNDSLSESSTDAKDKDTPVPVSDDSNKQIVLYDYSANASNAGKAVKNPGSGKSSSRSKAPPVVCVFTVQCGKCAKWRLIPDLETYEVIREHNIEQPFTCETTRQWNRVISCDDPGDLEPDETQIWAIDKPGIAKPPPGWKRLLRPRRAGSSKFADVYYVSPTGTKLRSIPDVAKYLDSHPLHAQGIKLGRFSFHIPKPLQEGYVRKRSKSAAYVPIVEPVLWAAPDEKLDIQFAEPISWTRPMENEDGMPAYLRPPELDPVSHAAKKAKSYPL